MKKLFTILFSLLFLTSFAQINGDYRSKASGTWLTPATWETFNGTSWVDATVPPNPISGMTSDNTITITTPNSVTYALADGSYTFLPKLTVESGASLLPDNSGAVVLTFSSVVTVNGNLTLTGAGEIDITIGTSGSMTIGADAEVTISGNFANNSSLGVDGLVIKSTSASSTGSLIYNSGSPLATVERYVPMDGWHFVAPATSGVTPQNFYIDENNSAWLTFWDEPSGTWDYFVDPLDDPLPLGSGYSYWWQDSPAREMTTPGTVEFKGNLQDPDIDLVVTMTDDGSGDDQGFGLVGNPWPSTMQLTPGLADNLTNVEATVWVWNNDLAWYEWASTGTVTGSGINPIEMNPAVVAIGQCAFMRALSGGGTVLFDGSARVHDQSAVFWKKSNDEEQVPIIQLLVTKDDKTDKGYIAFGQNGSPDFENGFDVTKLFGSELNSYVYLDEIDHKYAQSYLNTLEDTEERIITVYVRPGTEGEHTFAVNMEYIPDVSVTLEDTFTGDLIEMSNDVTYTFNATPGDNEDRFKMHFTRSVTGIENPGAKENAVNIYAYNKAVYISNNNNSTYETSKVSVYDMYGRQIYFNQMQLGNTTRIPVDVSNSYLIVKVANSMGTYNQKVFIK